MLRFAIIGCGTIAETHARALRALVDDALLTCCSDVVPERADGFGARFGIPARSLDEVLAASDVDAVVVCTPSGTHAEIGTRVLAAGKHLVVEKPMDVTLRACDELLAARGADGPTLTVISQHRFDDSTETALAAVREGRLGTVIQADCSVLWHRSQEYYDSGDWRGTWDLDGGGCLMNQGIHTIDLMLALLGPASSVYALARTAAHRGIEVEDVLCATVGFASGTIATVTASTSALPGEPARLSLYGTAGTLTIEGDRLTRLVTVDGEEHPPRRPSTHAVEVATGGSRLANRTIAETEPATGTDVWGEAHRRQLLDLVRAVESGRAPRVDGHAGRAAVELVRAAYDSARSGRAVHL